VVSREELLKARLVGAHSGIRSFHADASNTPCFVCRHNAESPSRHSPPPFSDDLHAPDTNFLSRRFQPPELLYNSFRWGASLLYVFDYDPQLFCRCPVDHSWSHGFLFSISFVATQPLLEIQKQFKY